MRCSGKRLISLILAIIMLVAVTVPVLASTYEAMVLVKETQSTAYEMLGIRVPANITWWAANGYIDADGRDSRMMRVSTECPHMLQDDNIFFADVVSALTSTSYDVATGETAQDMSIVPGHGGYVTVADAAALELGNNFRVEYYGYCGLVATRVHKPFSFWITDDGAGTIEGALLTNSDTLPTGFVDGSGTWANEAQAYDNLIATAATENVGAGVWGNYLELTHAAMDIEGVRYYISIGAHDVNDLVDIDVYDGTWHDVYQGSYTASAWLINTAVYEDITSIRFRFYNNNVGIQVASIFEGHYSNDVANLAVNAVGVSDGGHKVELYADGTNMYMEIDDIYKDFVGLAGASANDYDGNWILDADPWWSYYRHYVNAATLVVNYQPNDIISGTTLPDLEGMAQDGMFVYGNNPVGILLTMEEFEISDTPTIYSMEVETADTIDVITGESNMILEDFEMLMETNEFYFYIEWLAGVTSIDIPTLWWYLSALVSITGIALVQRYLRNIWLTGFTGAALTYFVVSMSGLEWWMATPIILATLFIGLWKRSAEV